MNNSTVTSIAGYITRIVELTEENKELRRMAYTDQLTGAHNRRALTERDDTHGYVILFDLNDFKLCNDTHGHAAGDAVLIDFVDTLHAIGVDVYRTGGDEFVALAAGARHARAIIHCIERWTNSGVTASPGAASIDKEGMGYVDKALSIADSRMYRTKRENGRRTHR